MIWDNKLWNQVMIVVFSFVCNLTSWIYCIYSFKNFWISSKLNETIVPSALIQELPKPKVTLKLILSTSKSIVNWLKLNGLNDKPSKQSFVSG